MAQRTARPVASRPAAEAAFLVFFVVWSAFALALLVEGIGAVAASRSAGLHENLHIAALGSGVVARSALRMADGAHKLQSLSQVVLDYAFSAFNFILAFLLVLLRRRDRTAKLLAIGLVGAAAVFNLEAQSTYESLVQTRPEAVLHAGFGAIAGLAYAAALLLFPDGRPVPRWHAPKLAVLYAPLTAATAWAAVRFPGSSRPAVLIVFFGLITPAAGVAAQAYRYRYARSSEEYQQARLLFWALLPALAVGVSFLALRGAAPQGAALEGRGLTELPVVLFRVFQIVFALVPLALLAGIFRYRLWDVDRVIVRTLVYGALAGFVSAVYIGVVVGIGRLVGSTGNNLLLSIAATGIVAAAFEPVKERFRKLAGRLVYGQRATPYEVLSQLCERMAEAYAPDDLLDRTAHVLAAGTGAAEAEVWVRVGAELRPAASWPGNGSTPAPLPLDGETLPQIWGVSAAVPVRHQQELLGALTLTKPGGESLTPTEEKLLADLASQAGLVLRNVRLTSELLERLEELRASRERIVTASDMARRRLERNIHDGAQQQLVALRVKLQLAHELMDDPSALGELLRSLHAEVGDALETLRELARGVFPAALRDFGIGRALVSQAAKSPIPVDSDVIEDRFEPAIEGAVYMCCLEAMQNAGKYAGDAATAKLRLWHEDGMLRFTFSDDGLGFDPATTPEGEGTQNMIDRIEALGGRIEITSTPGRGTTVAGAIHAAPVGQELARV